MNSSRSEIKDLQDRILKTIKQESINPNVVISGIGELLIHYCVTKRGTDFTAQFLGSLTRTLETIQEAVELSE